MDSRSKTYKKGNELKRNILNLAKHCFKEYGYSKTTFQMMADELGIAKASISYHFKSKALLLFYLFGKGLGEVYSYVQENKGDGFNAYTLYCITHVYFYRKIMQDERNSKLFYHLDNRLLWINEHVGFVEGYFKQVMIDFKKDFTEDEIHAMAVMSLGAKFSMFKEFIKEPGRISVDAYCYHTTYLVGLLSKLDEATIEKNIQNAFEFADSNVLPFIDFLD